MHHGFIDPEILQRLRLEIAAHSLDESELPELSGVAPDQVRLHMERLFYGGELSAEARIESNGLRLKPLRLTPYGVLAMHAGIARARTRRAA